MARTVIMRTQEGKSLHLECHESLPSVVELARSYAQSGYPDGYVVFSESQTKYNSLGEPLAQGKSERGVYLSCILRTSIFRSQAGFLGVMSAVALSNALEEQTMKKIGIGWVSDIFCEDRKIGTSSVEGKLDSFNSYEYIIVSFTVKLSESDFPPRLPDLVKKVFESDNTSLSLIIAKNILYKFFSIYPKRIKTPEKVMDAYKRAFALAGTKTKYFENGKKRSCKILNVNSKNCTLMIETHNGAIKIIDKKRSIIIPNKIKT